MRPIDNLRSNVDFWKKATTDARLKSTLYEVLKLIDEAIYHMDHQEDESPWHKVEEPPKEEGKYFVAYRSSVVDGWGYDTAYYTKHLEDKMLMIPVPENSEGWFNWSDYSDCDMLVFPDYWMSPEPPKEEE